MCKNNEIKIESGRSMVEILGALAIIGVLSIGGIAGYSYGMDKYKANQTVNDVMLMGVDIMTQLSQNRGVPTLTEWGTKTTAGYDFEVVQNPTDATQYGIQIMGVPSRICKMVGDGLKQTVVVWVGGEEQTADKKTDPCDESDKNTMEFYFAKNTGDGTCTQTCTQCQVCSEGKCVNKNDGEECFNGTCQNGFCINNFREIYSSKECSSDTECYGECEFCDLVYGSGYCRSHFENENVSCDNGRGICIDHGSNAAACVIPETCETNADCDKFGKDYYCGFSSWGKGFQCVQMDFVPYNINGEQVMLSRKAVLDYASQPEKDTSSQNACERLGMYAATIICPEDYWGKDDLEACMCQNDYIVCSSEEKQFHLSSQEETTIP